MPDCVDLAAIFPLAARFRNIRSPFTCRHRHRCDCHQTSGQPATTAAADQTTPAAASASASASDLQTLDLRWRKLVADILDTLRDFDDAYEAVRLTMRRVCEAGFP